MPGSLLDADVSFPEIRGKRQEDINREIVDYLYMLLEQLRYSFGNIGLENFNETEFELIAELIQEPVYARLTDEEGDLAELSLLAQGLVSRLSDAEGNITTLTQTSETLSGRLQNAEGDLTELTATAEGLQERIQDAEGDLLSLSETAAGLLLRIQDAEGDVTDLSAVAAGLQASVRDLDSGMSHTLRLGADGMTVYDANGKKVTISNGNLDLTGAITFSDLDDDTQEAIDSAKTRTFKDQPTGPYYVGDLWYKDDGTVWRCEIDEPRAGRFYSTDWEQVNDAGSVANEAKSAAESALAAASGKNQTFYGTTVRSPYTAGDLWFTTGGIVYRCNYTRTGYGQYYASDWTLVNDAQELVGQWGYEYQGTTYMDGRKLMTGTVTASTLRGGEVQLLGENGSLVGHIDITPTNDGYGLQFTTDQGGMRFVTGGNFFIQNDDQREALGFGLMNNTGWGWALWSAATVNPLQNNKYTLGAQSYQWSDLYCVNSTIQTSDAKRKKDVEDLPEKYVDMFSALRPVRFRRTDGQSGRYHVGFISQEVEAAMTACGIDSTEFAGFVKDRGPDGEDIYMLRYEELIGVLWAKVREMDRRMEELRV